MGEIESGERPFFLDLRKTLDITHILSGGQFVTNCTIASELVDYILEFFYSFVVLGVDIMEVLLMHVELVGVFLDGLANRSEIDRRFFDLAGEIVSTEKLIMLTSNNSFVKKALGLDNLTLTSSDKSGERHHIFEEVVGFIITSDCVLEDDERVTKRIMVDFFHDKLLLMN